MPVLKWRPDKSSPFVPVGGGGAGGMTASIIVNGLSESDTVTATMGDETIEGVRTDDGALVATEIPTLTGESPSCYFEGSGTIADPAWQAFDDNTHTSAYFGSITNYPFYLVYDFVDKAVKPNSFYGYAEHAWDIAGQGTGTYTVQLQGSNDGQAWENISGEVVWNDRGLKWHDSSSTEDVNIVTEVSTDKFYTKFRLAVLSSSATQYANYCRIFTFQVTGEAKKAPYFAIRGIADRGMWTVTATNGEDTVSQDVLVDSAADFEIEMNYALWLYREGDECEDVTGGWISQGLKYLPDAGQKAVAPTLTKNEYSLVGYLGTFAGGGIMLCANKIDLTNYDALVFSGTFESKALLTLQLSIWSSIGSYVPDNVVAYLKPSKYPTTYVEQEIDISALEGSYYIGFGFYGCNGDAEGNYERLTMTEMKLK